MNILVTGYDGYIGSVLTPILIQRGYNVVGLDTGYYSSGSLYNEVAHPSKIIRKDIRNISKNDFDGVLQEGVTGEENGHTHKYSIYDLVAGSGWTESGGRDNHSHRIEGGTVQPFESDGATHMHTLPKLKGAE